MSCAFKDHPYATFENDKDGEGTRTYHTSSVAIPYKRTCVLLSALMDVLFVILGLERHRTWNSHALFIVHDCVWIASPGRFPGGGSSCSEFTEPVHHAIKFTHRLPCSPLRQRIYKLRPLSRVPCLPNGRNHPCFIFFSTFSSFIPQTPSHILRSCLFPPYGSGRF